MRISHFPNFVALNGSPVLNALTNCLKTHGHSIENSSLDADVAVIWSVLWHGRMFGNKEIYYHYRNSNRPVIIVETGALCRGKTWKISVNNITAQGQYGNQYNLDYSRPAKLGISLENLKNPSPHILIASQHTQSLQLESIKNIEWWIKTQIEELRKTTDRPIIVRPHPRCKLDTKTLPRNITIEQPSKIPNTYDNFNINYNCHAVINYNSGVGIQAAIAGTRVIVDKSSLAYPVSTKIADIESQNNIARDEWLIKISHTEYTMDEIQKGLWLTRILPIIQ